MLSIQIVQAAGAYRGYGATQGIFAVESAVNELAERLHMDPVEFRIKKYRKEGDVMPAYYGETAQSCALDRCLERTAELIGWKDKYPCKDMGNGKVRKQPGIAEWQCRGPDLGRRRRLRDNQDE